MNLNLTEEEVDDLLVSGHLTITKNIHWRLKNGNSFYCFKVPVMYKHLEIKYSMELGGTKNPSISNYSFVLLLNGQRIRGLDPQGRHNNRPRGSKEIIKYIIGLHKHKWIDPAYTTFAYVPLDITDTLDISLTFRQFLSECGIIFTGTFDTPPHTQPALPLMD